MRGICCLRPGIAGVSENIEVRSIIDRYLEHSRVFYFRNGGHEEVYLSSADWMHRNLDKRVEILFPIVAGNLRRRLIDILKTYFADNAKAQESLADGTWQPVPRGALYPAPRRNFTARRQELPKRGKHACAGVPAAEEAEGVNRPYGAGGRVLSGPSPDN